MNYAEAFVLEGQLTLFEEHQRLNADHELKTHIAGMMRDIYEGEK